LLGLAAKLGSEAAHARLLEAAKANNVMAAMIAFKAGALTEKTAEHCAQMLARLLDDERQKAARGVSSFGHPVDRCLFLVSLSLSFPRAARWAEVMSYLGDSAIDANHKKSSVWQVVREFALLPDEAANLLALQAPGLQASFY